MTRRTGVQHTWISLLYCISSILHHACMIYLYNKLFKSHTQSESVIVWTLPEVVLVVLHRQEIINFLLASTYPYLFICLFSSWIALALAFSKCQIHGYLSMHWLSASWGSNLFMRMYDAAAYSASAEDKATPYRKCLLRYVAYRRSLEFDDIVEKDFFP